MRTAKVTADWEVEFVKMTKKQKRKLMYVGRCTNPDGREQRLFGEHMTSWVRRSHLNDLKRYVRSTKIWKILE